MVKKVCIIHTETTGLHELRDEKVYKKNLFGFARLVSFSWIIAVRESGDKFKIEKKQKFIIKPRCLQIPDEIVQFHGISQEVAKKKGTEIEQVLDAFKSDLIGVSVIVSHSLEFHLKAVQAELVRYNKAMDFNKFLLIDLNSFEHNITPSTLQNLSQKLLKKDLKDKALVNDYICELFFKLYNEYEKKIKTIEL
jgi:DNA polymerase III epsilon subunit-like protein